MAAPFPSTFLRRLEALRLRARRRYLGSRPGGHASPRRGTSLEFRDFRSYTPGDDPRAVDWSLYARTDRLYVKVFEEEEDLFVYVLVDATASMAAPLEKYEAARRLALALVYVALSAGDAVRIHRLGGAALEATPFQRGRRSFFEADRFLSRDLPSDRERLPEAVARALATLKRPGKVVLVSDLLHPVGDVSRVVKLLYAANVDAAFLHVLSPEELAPRLFGASLLVDAETGGEREIEFDEPARSRYLERLARHRAEVASLCHRAGFAYALFDASADLESFVLSELPALGLLRGA